MCLWCTSGRESVTGHDLAMMEDKKLRCDRAAIFSLRRWAAYGAAEEGDGDDPRDEAGVGNRLTATQVLPVNTIKAWLIGFGIFLYFVITTTWLPSKLILGPLGASSRFVQDLVTTTVWGFFLVAGMVALRVAQRRGLI